MDPKAYECEICTDYLWSPVLKCYKDHLFCEKCIDLVPVCPTCRENLPRSKLCHAALEVYIARSWFRCEFRDEGCNAVVKLIRMDHHTRSCTFRTGRHCTVLGFANCDQLVSMPRLMDHAKFIHKIACLSVDLHEEFEVKQVIKSETDGQKPVKLARVNWEPVFLFIEGTRHIFQLNTKFFDSNHFPNAKCGCKVGWEMQERSSSGGAYVGRISFIKDSSQTYCETWTWKGTIPKENCGLDNPKHWFHLPSKLIAGRSDWKLRILIKPQTLKSLDLDRPSTCTTVINKTVEGLNEPTGMFSDVGRFLRNSIPWALLLKLGLAILLGCLLVFVLISVITYLAHFVGYLGAAALAVLGFFVLVVLATPPPPDYYRRY